MFRTVHGLFAFPRWWAKWYNYWHRNKLRVKTMKEYKTCISFPMVSDVWRRWNINRLSEKGVNFVDLPGFRLNYVDRIKKVFLYRFLAYFEWNNKLHTKIRHEYYKRSTKFLCFIHFRPNTEQLSNCMRCVCVIRYVSNHGNMLV